MNLINNIKSSFNKLNYKLLISIVVTLFIPIIYRTLRMFWIGSMPDSWSYSVAANMQWIGVLFEVLEEAFILPFFYAISTIFKKSEDNENRKLVGKIIPIVLIYLLFITLFISIASPLMNFMSNTEVTSTGLTYVRWEFVNRVLAIIFKIGVTIFIAKNWQKMVYIYVIIELFLMSFTDIFLISSFSFSLNLGVVGIGYSNFISYLTVDVFIAIVIFKKMNFKWEELKTPIFKSATKEWREYLISGLESFVRNAFFIWFVVRIIGKLNEGANQGDFWVTNSFIWDWLLLPIIAIGQYVNRDSALQSENRTFFEKFGALFVIIAIVNLSWFVFVPAYSPFIKYVYKNDNYELISKLIIISLAFYIPFSFNELLDKSLYGEGKAWYMLFQSIFTNIVIYIPFFFLVTKMNIEMVALMFGTAIATDSFLTFVMYWLVNKIKGSEKLHS